MRNPTAVKYIREIEDVTAVRSPTCVVARSPHIPHVAVDGPAVRELDAALELPEPSHLRLARRIGLRRVHLVGIEET